MTKKTSSRRIYLTINLCVLYPNPQKHRDRNQHNKEGGDHGEAFPVDTGSILLDCY